MDEQSDETGEEEVMGEGIGESEVGELVPKWGWRRDKGSWFQRHGEAYRKKRSVILREDDIVDLVYNYRISLLDNFTGDTKNVVKFLPNDCFFWIYTHKYINLSPSDW